MPRQTTKAGERRTSGALRLALGAMSALASVALWLGAWGVGGEAAAQDGAKRFPHEKHLDKIKNCTGCHVLDKATWEQKAKVASKHEPCNTSICHGEEWKKEPGDFCLTCHEKSLKVVYPPYRGRGASDWVTAKFSHKDHIKDQGNKSCEGCHAKVKVAAPKKGEKLLSPANDMARASHKECSKCHAKGISPAMADCQGCHEPSTGKVAPLASSQQDNYRVSYTFKHEAHAKTAKGNDCVGCHRNAMTGAGQAVPLPAMKDCESCHDGAKAFHALGPSCKRCHSIPGGL